MAARDRCGNTIDQPHDCQRGTAAHLLLEQLLRFLHLKVRTPPHDGDRHRGLWHEGRRLGCCGVDRLLRRRSSVPGGGWSCCWCRSRQLRVVPWRPCICKDHDLIAARVFPSKASTDSMGCDRPLTRLALPTAQAARCAPLLVPTQRQAAVPVLRVLQPAVASTPSASQVVPASSPAHRPLLMPIVPAWTSGEASLLSASSLGFRILATSPHHKAMLHQSPQRHGTAGMCAPNASPPVWAGAPVPIVFIPVPMSISVPVIVPAFSVASVMIFVPVICVAVPAVVLALPGP
jgi:hypothetical protein